MADISYNRKEAIIFISDFIDDINETFSSIDILKVNIEQRLSIKQMINEIEKAFGDETVDSGVLYGMYNKLMRSLPESIKNRINTIRNVKHDINRIRIEPSIFEQCNKRLRESNIMDEYNRIFVRKFEEYLFKMHGINAQEYDKEFYQSMYAQWLASQRMLFRDYVGFLRKCKLAPNKDKENPTELFKGSYDTLKEYYPVILGVFSRYASTIETDSISEGLNSFDDIYVKKDGSLYPIIETNAGSKLRIPFEKEAQFTYYVHNPYDDKEKEKILRLLQNPNMEVTFGLYGYKCEEDIDKKVEELRRLKKEIPGAQFFTQEFDDDSPDAYNIGLLYKPRRKRD